MIVLQACRVGLIDFLLVVIMYSSVGFWRQDHGSLLTGNSCVLFIDHINILILELKSCQLCVKLFMAPKLFQTCLLWLWFLVNNFMICLYLNVIYAIVFIKYYLGIYPRTKSSNKAILLKEYFCKMMQTHLPIAIQLWIAHRTCKIKSKSNINSLNKLQSV